MNCIVQSGRLIRLNYELCFVLLASAEQRENKKALRHALNEFASEKLPGDDGSIASAISNVSAMLELETVFISRYDRHSWSVSIFINHENAVILIDAVDWGLSILLPGQSPIVITSNKQHELSQIVNHYDRQSLLPLTDHNLQAGDAANVIVSSARFYDSLMFSFAIDHYLTTRQSSTASYRKINLLLMKGMYYRGFEQYLNRDDLSVVEIDNAQLKVLMDKPYVDKVQCIRLPFKNWRDIYRDRFMEYVGERSRLCEARVWKDKRYQIFISIELEKRRWQEQEEALCLFLHRLHEKCGPLRVLINGLTAPFGAPLPATYDGLRQEEHGIIDKIKINLGSCDIEFHSLFGRALDQKINDIRGSDCFFAPLGSACVVPAYMNIHGVAYGTKDFVAENKWLFAGLDRIKILDPSLVTRVQDDLSIMKFPWARAGSSGDSYSLDPHIAVRETLDFLLDEQGK